MTDDRERLRIGVIYDACNNAYYRAIDPMRALARRGHDVVWPDRMDRIDISRLTTCDVVHIYRRPDEWSERAVRALTRAGIPFLFDNDDDFTLVPKESANFKKVGGVIGQRIFATTVKIARQAYCFTTTTPAIASRYQEVGVERTVVIPNVLDPARRVRRTRHDGIVIGWVAGGEHIVDAKLIPIRDALTRILAKHPHVEVCCVGVDLGLPQRYRHVPPVDFLDLPRLISGFDIGIAPLADTPFGRSRSDIKVKEYANCGIPWLASPVGPYASYGPNEGGRLVPDDAWYEALDDLIRHPWRRRWQGLNAWAWARKQTIESTAGLWEQLLQEAVRRGKPSVGLAG